MIFFYYFRLKFALIFATIPVNSLSLPSCLFTSPIFSFFVRIAAAKLSFLTSFLEVCLVGSIANRGSLTSDGKNRESERIVSAAFSLSIFSFSFWSFFLAFWKKKWEKKNFWFGFLSAHFAFFFLSYFFFFFDFCICLSFCTFLVGRGASSLYLLNFIFFLFILSSFLVFDLFLVCTFFVGKGASSFLFFVGSIVNNSNSAWLFLSWIDNWRFFFLCLFFNLESCFNSLSNVAQGSPSSEPEWEIRKKKKKKQRRTKREQEKRKRKKKQRRKKTRREISLSLLAWIPVFWGWREK